MMAVELSAWCHALLSWRKKPRLDDGKKAYSYNDADSYMNMMLGVGLAFPVEIVAVHMLLAQWSAMAATIVTLLSIYAAIWLVGDARARILRPVVLGNDDLRIECGIQMEFIVPTGSIFEISGSEPKDFSKSEKLNYGTFYQETSG